MNHYRPTTYNKTIFNMKKIIILTLQSFIMLPIMGQTNDYTMQVTLQDGTVMTIPTNEIKQIDYQQVSSTPTDNLALLEKMTGKWQFVASNNGTMGADGIYTSGTDYIHFTATMPPADSDNYGYYLYCHTDELYTRTGKNYPADWLMKIEQDGDKIRIGWVLDADQPASTLEFNEPANHYLENGSFYWGKEDGGHLPPVSGGRSQNHAGRDRRAGKAPRRTAGQGRTAK